MNPPINRDIEYYQIRLWQLRKHLKNSRDNWPNICQELMCQDVIKDIQYCKRKLEQRFRAEVMFHKHNEIMY